MPMNGKTVRMLAKKGALVGIFYAKSLISKGFSRN